MAEKMPKTPNVYIFRISISKYLDSTSKYLFWCKITTNACFNKLLRYKKMSCDEEITERKQYNNVETFINQSLGTYCRICHHPNQVSCRISSILLILVIFSNISHFSKMARQKKITETKNDLFVFILLSILAYGLPDMG